MVHYPPGSASGLADLITERTGLGVQSLPDPAFTTPSPSNSYLPPLYLHWGPGVSSDTGQKPSQGQRDSSEVKVLVLQVADPVRSGEAEESWRSPFSLGTLTRFGEQLSAFPHLAYLE